MRAPRALRTALVAAGVSAALGGSAAGAFAQPAPAASAAHANGHPRKPNRVHVKTVKLADNVSHAKVYETGQNRYEAEIWAEDRKDGTLYTQGRAAYALNNGLHVTLHPNGEVTSRVERARPPQLKPVAERVLVASPTLADGVTTAKLYRLTADHYEADIFTGVVRLHTLVADGRAAHGDTNGLHVALQPDGRLTSRVDGTP